MKLRIEIDTMAPVPDGREHGLTALAERVWDSAPALGQLDAHCPPNLLLMAATPREHKMESSVRVVEVG